MLSNTNIKRSGESGHPCLIPCSSLKKGEVYPFIRISKEVVEMQFITHVTKEWEKPGCIKNSLIYSQLTLSKYFERSILRVMTFFLFV
jgi:hypothetical protein